MVLAPRRAVNETERRLCGSAAVTRPAVAEGLALRGRRAATLLAPPDSGPLGSDTASVRVAWVHHRIGLGPTSGFAFELAADGTQDAIDHCLVAHDLSLRLGAPGLCTLAAARSDSLEPAELPDETVIRELDRDRGEPSGSTAELAEESFRRVSAWTGRPLSTVTVEGPADAKHAVVTAGLSLAPARELVRGLEKDGIRCRLVCVHLVRPFPAAALGRAVAGARNTLLLASCDAFVEAARHAMPSDPIVAEASIDAARAAFGLDAQIAAKARDDRTPLVLTARPAGPWAETFLLDVAERLTGVEGLAWTARADLLVAEHPESEPATDAPVGVALCAHPDYLESSELLPRMAERATLVLVSTAPPPDRWWDELDADTRETILGRELTVRWLDLGAIDALDVSDPAACRAVLVDAVAAVAAPAGDGAAPDFPVRLDVRALEAARDKTSGSRRPSLPRMPAAAKEEDVRWRNAARRFHLTGEGAHSDMEPTLAEPLHPHVLQALEHEEPEDGQRLDAATLLGLHAAAVRDVRLERRESLRDEILNLTERLEERIALDEGRAPENLSAEALGSALGEDAPSYLDAEKLAESLRRQRGSRRLDDRRSERIREALAALRRGLESDPDTDLILVRPDSAPAFDALPGVVEIVHPRGLGAAIGLFEGLAADYTEMFRALRVARLELDDAYEPELHDEPLARLEWQGLGEDELLALPRLVVLETDARLRGAGLGALAELLRSGRPVHVLVLQSSSEFRVAENWQGLAGFHPGLGYLAVAHREAFVVESSVVRRDRLERDLRRMASSLRPGAAFVAVPDGNATVRPALQLLAAEHGRAAPYFSYDPEAGLNWAERFDLEDNPQAERPWPLHGVRYLDDTGEEATLEQAFTFAHAVALDPSYRRHFRIVPERAWSSEQMELGEYLASPVPAVARKIPFLWVVHEGRLARALLTRELAWATRDRLRAWHILQELAGTDNEYARRAAERERTEASAQAEIHSEAREAEHTTELERTRSEAVREAIERLARRLVGVEAGPLPQGLATAPAAATETIATSTNGDTAAPPSPGSAEPAAAVTDAYIDTALCTSCGDCININPRLFKYDENKQAFIADIHAGTYAELVKAAEKCPARCIHPGLPVAGDKTANDRMLARAAKFN